MKLTRLVVAFIFPLILISIGCAIPLQVAKSNHGNLANIQSIQIGQFESSSVDIARSIKDTFTAHMLKSAKVRIVESGGDATVKGFITISSGSQAVLINGSGGGSSGDYVASASVKLFDKSNQLLVMVNLSQTRDTIVLSGEKSTIKIGVQLADKLLAQLK